ncbi:hypothetical protein F5888DRAFT_1807515 [Russula emetica]|nr:hypothetical protein F5888DRAFT_1807515 [Russula emetica]
MSWQQPSPPSSFPQPYATHWSSNPAQNEASVSARTQDGLPPRNGYPPMHNASVSSSQAYSSPQPPPPPSRRSTHPTAPTYEHASSFPPQPVPPPSGSVSHYQPSPARYASISSSSPPPPMTQRAATMPMPVYPNIAQSMPYDMSPHSPSRSEMSGGPQASSQSWSYLDVNEGEDDSSDFSGGDLEQSSESMSDFQKRSPPSFPFAASRKSRESLALRKAPRKGLTEWFANTRPTSL